MARGLGATLLCPLATLATLVGACGEPAASSARPAQAPAAPAVRASEYPSEDGAWGKFHSKRFQLSIPLPDGRKWKIDDHSRPSLLAVHEATSSRLHVLQTHEDELMNRQRCEARAKELGWVPAAPLTTVEDEVTVGPEAYDSRVWVAVDAGKRGGSVTGHVFLFGAFIRKCLLVHLETTVPSAQEESVLSSRLATASARVVRAITLDPPRTTDDATVPKDKPDIRR